MGSSHSKRWITAAVALPILALVLVAGGPTGFALLIAFFSVLALIEYYGLLLPEETPVAIGLGVFCTVAILVAFFFASNLGVLAVLVFSFVVFSAFHLSRTAPPHWAVERMSKQLLGLIYIPTFAGHMIALRNNQDGFLWTVMLLAIVFAGDTGAYYVGKSMGRKKLCPRISPGKTVAGAVGGLGAGVVVACFLKAGAFGNLSWLSCIGVAVLTGAVAQLGDLFESVLKRSVNSKDSGRLLPGHGGVLDRIDGLLFAAPVLYYLKDMVM